MSIKQPRSIVLANNWKNKEISNVLKLRDEMVEYSIDNVLIQEFLDEEYSRINTKYNERINKYHNMINNTPNIKEKKKAREQSINFLIKNKTFLEEKGFKSEYINNYVEKHYKLINDKFNNKIINNKNNNIFFID